MIVFTRLFEDEKRDFSWPETLVQEDIDQRRRMLLSLFKKLGQRREKHTAKSAIEERRDDRDGEKSGDQVLDPPPFEPPPFLVARLQFLLHFNQGDKTRFSFEEKTQDTGKRRSRPKR